jgi:hypothetical protein
MTVGDTLFARPPTTYGASPAGRAGGRQPNSGAHAGGKSAASRCDATTAPSVMPAESTARERGGA